LSLLQNVSLDNKPQHLLYGIDSDTAKTLLVINALWSAAIVRYGRCFHSGKRFKLSPNLLSDLPGAVDTHQYFYEMRNKHTAHTANDFDQYLVGLALTTDADGKRTVVGIGELRANFVSSSEEGIDTLRRLAKALQQKLAPLILLGRAELQKEGKALSTAELSTLSEIRYVAPGPDEVTKKGR